MKRILLSLLMLSGVCASAQETAHKQDFDIIYVEAGTSAGKQIGVVWEFESWLHKKKLRLRQAQEKSSCQAILFSRCIEVNQSVCE